MIEYQQIPFKEKGRDRDGCDCWGLVRLVLMERFGVENLPLLLDGYARTQDREDIARMVDANKALLDFAEVDAPQPGDVVVIRQKGEPCHVGVMINRREVMHTEEDTGVRIDDISRPYIRPRIDGFFRARCRMSASV